MSLYPVLTKPCTFSNCLITRSSIKRFLCCCEEFSTCYKNKRTNNSIYHNEEQVAFFQNVDGVNLLRNYRESPASIQNKNPLFSIGKNCFDLVMDFARDGESVELHDNMDSDIFTTIACQNDEQQFVNPFKSGMIKTNQKATIAVNYEYTEDLSVLFDEIKEETDKYISTGKLELSFPHHAIRPTGYQLTNGGGKCIYIINISVLRHWIFEGKRDGDSQWTPIQEVQDDCFVRDIQEQQNDHYAFTSHYYRISSPSEHFYTSIRIRNLSTNLSTHSILPLYINSFQIYGSLKTFKM
ncbi:hypothetical protein WA158_007902 [Blastocystis sp. Blastoise]